MCVWAPVCYALIGRAGLGGLLTGAGVPWSASCDCVDCVGREAIFLRGGPAITIWTDLFTDKFVWHCRL